MPAPDTPVSAWTTAPVRGAAWMVGAAASFVMMSWAVRALAPITASEVVFFRSLVGLALVAPLLREPWPMLLRPRWPKLYLLRGVLSYLAMLAWFYALQKVVLADAVALQFTLPLFTILFAIFVFHEPVGTRRWIATLIGFAGALLIIRPGFAEVDAVLLLVLFSAATYAAANMVIKKLTRTEPPTTVVFYLHAATLPLALAGAIPYWIWPGWAELPWIVLLAAAGTLAHYCFTKALGTAEVAVVMPFDYLRLPMIAAVGYFAYGEKPALWTWIGAAVICGASLYILRREARLAQGGAAKAETKDEAKDDGEEGKGA